MLRQSGLDGEQDALTVLFDRYHERVFSVAVRIVDDSGEAEEVVLIPQELACKTFLLRTGRIRDGADPTGKSESVRKRGHGRPLGDAEEYS
jgi:hypothetical protein